MHNDIEKISKCCETCSHCDVIDWYCYQHNKPIENINDNTCDEWEEWKDG